MEHLPKGRPKKLTKDLTQVCPESWARNPQVVLSQLGYSLWLSPVLDSKDSGESDPVPSRKANLRERPSTDTGPRQRVGSSALGRTPAEIVCMLGLPS